MYMKNLKNRITLRLDDDLIDFINDYSDSLSISPSAFIRLTLKCVMLNSKKEVSKDDNIESI